MSSAPAADRLVFLSDLHLAAGQDEQTGRTDPFDRDRALVRFLRHLGTHPEQPDGVVLLGDTVDLLELELRAVLRGRAPGGRRWARQRLGRVASAHGEVFSALGELVANGTRLHVVAGNHDVELVDSAIQELLAELVTGDRGGNPDPAIVFHPWIFHIPDVVYAEHGNQYHDINAFRTFLAPFGPDGMVARPPAALLERVSAAVRMGVTRAPPGRAERTTPQVDGRPRPLAAVARAIASGVRTAVRMSVPGHDGPRDRYRRTTLARYATEVGIDQRTLVRLDRLSEATTWSIARRIGRDQLRPGRDRHSLGYMPTAAREIARVLRAGGHGAPFLVFGHTHHAVDLALEGRHGRYLNTGSWTRQAVADRATGVALTFVEVRRTRSDGWVAAVRQWDDANARVRGFHPVPPHG